jgi:hypothetical protein
MIVSKDDIKFKVFISEVLILKDTENNTDLRSSIPNLMVEPGQN